MSETMFRQSFSQWIRPSSRLRRGAVVARRSSCGLRLQCVRLQHGQGDEEQLGAHLCQTVVKHPVGLCRTDRRFLLEEDGAGVHPFIHSHDRHPRLFFSPDQRPVDRRRPPVLRKEGRVDVDAAQSQDRG